MKTHSISTLNPELVIGTTEAIDRMSLIASQAVNERKHNYTKQIQLVRTKAKSLCQAYKNCREEDWCFLCNSGQSGDLYLGTTCLSCKLLTADVLTRFKTQEINNENQTRTQEGTRSS